MDRTQFWMKAWGVRGSLPVPGDSTIHYGGNTSCYEVRCGEERIIIDAGTGIVGLGRSWMAEKTSINAHILFSHLHWDHIQGLPFFPPAFIPGNKFTVTSGKLDGGTAEEALTSQMTRPQFPVPFDIFNAHFDFKLVTPGDSFSIGDAQVSTFILKHPGGAVGYRIDYQGHSFVYAVDTEHPEEGLDQDVVNAAKNTDILVYDACYTDDQYNGVNGMATKGFGHSTWRMGIETAKAANVKLLALSHHEINHSDQKMAAIHKEANAVDSRAFVLFEGCQIDLLNPQVPQQPNM